MFGHSASFHILDDGCVVDPVLGVRFCVTDTSLSWSGGDIACVTNFDGTRLAMIETQAEQDVVDGFLDAEGVGEAWFGARFMDSDTYSRLPNGDPIDGNSYINYKLNNQNQL